MLPDSIFWTTCHYLISLTPVLSDCDFYNDKFPTCPFNIPVYTYSAKGPLCIILGKMINVSYLLHVINTCILKGCMDRSCTIDSSGSVNCFFLSQAIRYEFERRIQHILRSHQAFFHASHQL